MEKNKFYTSEQILKEFEKLKNDKKCKILREALKLSLQRRAGTEEYAIANSMGYIYQDDGSYTK